MSYLGIDVGTSRTKAVAFDEEFNELSQSSAAYERTSLRPGWSELDPDRIAHAVRHVIGECSAACKADPIRSISFSVFGGGICAIDARRRPLLNVISTTDNRAREQADRWAREFGRERTYGITGTTTHSSLMLPKSIWIKEHLANASEIYQFVTTAEIAQTVLGIEPRMDAATASTTMMLDITSRKWSDEILQAAGISAAMLPAVIASGDVVGEIPAGVCDDLGLAPGCLVIAGGHDQQVCALGAGLVAADNATDSLGTVECITTLFDEPILNDDLLSNNFSNLLHVHGAAIASQAYNFSSGDLLHWYRKTFSQENLSFEEMFSRLPENPSGVLVLPHFCGSGTPHLDALSKGAMVGLSLETDKLDILRGIIDSQNYEMRLNLEIWKRNGIAFDSLSAYGQGSSSDALLQIKSDMLNIRIQKLSMVETGCLGAALLAAGGAEPDFALEEVLGKVVRVHKVFRPRKQHADVYDEKYALYREIYPSIRRIHHRM